MAAPRIPTWKQRLRACFSWRHRLMHVFGAPAAIGAATAVASAAALNPDVGMALGAMAAGVGTVLAGWWVTAGYDRKLITQLQREQVEGEQKVSYEDVQHTIEAADPEIRAVLQRILGYHAQIDYAFADGIDDQVEAILQSSRDDLGALKDRAISMTKLYRRLKEIIQQSDGRWLSSEVQRMDGELKRAQDGPSRDALLAAREATARTLAQWQAAIDKQNQIRNVLTMIESSLQEFKLAMELRKADAVLGSQEAGPEVSELQARLQAAGDACDELVGRQSASPRDRVRRARRPA